MSSHSNWCAAPVFTSTETIDSVSGALGRATRTVYRFGDDALVPVSRYVEGRPSEHYWVTAAYARQHCAQNRRSVGLRTGPV